MKFYTDIKANNNVVILFDNNTEEFLESIEKYEPIVHYLTDKEELHESHSLNISKHQIYLIGIHTGRDKSGFTDSAFAQPIEFILNNSPFEIHLVGI
ncbi:20167_t:CDS:2 [Racocetra fulgida]|uniref:20167_t:CDS:1 n=1 Tax=Racocetra fulgida TaxID=60492 RepID=A0A9N8WNL3_9GLOM|nr:20167_t:CDS:2 [Racocetra fulgida]